MLITFIIVAVLIVALAAGVWMTCGAFVYRKDRKAELERLEALQQECSKLRVEAEALQARANAPHQSVLKSI